MATPFSAAAEGARVPDAVSFPTSTLTLTRRYTISSDAAGRAEVICLPNLAASLWSPGGNLDSTSRAFYGSVSGVNQLGPVGSIGGFDISQTTGLGGYYHRYRIVGWGVRIKGVGSLTTSGECIVAPLMGKGLAPSSSDYIPQVIDSTGAAINVPSYSTQGAVLRDTADQLMFTLGVPRSGTGDAARPLASGLVALPGHGTVSYAQLAAHGLHLRSKPFDPRAHNFRNVLYTTTGNDAVDTFENVSASYCTGRGVNYEPWQVDGWSSQVVCFTGLPASTTIGTIEVIYHVEATLSPSMPVSLGRASATPSPVNPTEYDLCRREISKLAHVSLADVVQSAEDYAMGTVEGLAGNAVRSIGSTALGVLTRAVSAMGLA